MEQNNEKIIDRIIEISFSSYLLEDRKEINYDIFNLMIAGLKTPEGLPFLTPKDNICLKEFIGLNAEEEVKTTSYISDKYQMSASKGLARNAADFLIIRMRFLDSLLQSDPSVGLETLYIAMTKLSNKTLNSLYRNGINTISGFMSLDEETIVKVRGAGKLALSEIKTVQYLLNNPDKILEDESTIIDDEKKEMLKKKLLLLAETKQQLLEKINSIDSEMNEILAILNNNVIKPMK